MTAPATPCNPPAESRSSIATSGIHKPPWPTAGTARPPRAENLPALGALPNTPSSQEPNPDSGGRRASVAWAPEAGDSPVSRGPLCPACPVYLAPNRKAPTGTPPRMLRRFSRVRSPGRQLLPALQHQLGGLHRPHPGVLRVLCDRRALDRDFVADLHRVPLPSAARQRIRRTQFEAELLGRAALVLHVEKDVGVRIHPVHFRDKTGQSRGLVAVVFRLERMMRRRRFYRQQQQAQPHQRNERVDSHL